MMEYTAGSEDEGRLLRDVLRQSMRISYTALKNAKWNGEILVNGQTAHTVVRLREGDRIEIRWPEEKPAYSLKPYSLALRIPWEDEYLMVIDKPAGLACQSSRNHPDDSLENAVYAWLGCPGKFIYRPVNRLDKGTGGLMVIARSAYSQHLLQQVLHTTNFRRRYLALTDGIPPEKKGILAFPIGKVAGASVKRQADPTGKPCVTRYRVLGERGSQALVMLELETGRTHQIRVHLSTIGCPVSGDFLYGREDPGHFPGCFALHSAGLRLKYPVTGKMVDLISVPDWAKGMDEILLRQEWEEL